MNPVRMGFGGLPLIVARFAVSVAVGWDHLAAREAAADVVAVRWPRGSSGAPRSSPRSGCRGRRPDGREHTAPVAGEARRPAAAPGRSAWTCCECWLRSACSSRDVAFATGVVNPQRWSSPLRHVLPPRRRRLDLLRAVGAVHLPPVRAAPRSADRTCSDAHLPCGGCRGVPAVLVRPRVSVLTAAGPRPPSGQLLADVLLLNVVRAGLGRSA